MEGVINKRDSVAKSNFGVLDLKQPKFALVESEHNKRIFYAALSLPDNNTCERIQACTVEFAFPDGEFPVSSDVFWNVFFPKGIIEGFDIWLEEFGGQGFWWCFF